MVHDSNSEMLLKKPTRTEQDTNMSSKHKVVQVWTVFFLKELYFILLDVWLLSWLNCSGFQLLVVSNILLSNSCPLSLILLCSKDRWKFLCHLILKIVVTSLKWYFLFKHGAYSTWRVALQIWMEFILFHLLLFLELV